MDSRTDLLILGVRSEPVDPVRLLSGDSQGMISEFNAAASLKN